MQNLDALERAFASSLDAIKEMKSDMGYEDMDSDTEKKPTSEKIDELLTAIESMLSRMQKMMEENRPHCIPYVA